MDEYKEFFYKMVPSARRVDAGDMTARRDLRDKLKCKSFKWYLEQVYPEVSCPLFYFLKILSLQSPIPSDYLSLGQISTSNQQCIDTVGQKAGGQVKAGPCHGQGGNQVGF